MTTIKKAIIKSYDPAAHKATVQGATPSTTLDIEVKEGGATVGTTASVTTIEVYESGVLVGSTP